ncbi:hypothetical protein ACLKA6_006512 [Drosophila palustris]
MIGRIKGGLCKFCRSAIRSSHKLNNTNNIGQRPLELYKRLRLTTVKYQSTFILCVLQLQSIRIKMFKALMICAIFGLAAAAVHTPHPVPHVDHHVEHHAVGHADDVHADVVSRSDDVRADGFDHVLETSNHISRSDHSDEHGNQHGSYGWISPEGQHIEIKYTADEHGFHATGDAVPAVPDWVGRQLAWNAEHAHEEVHSHGHNTHH